jgi:hypothetical protein
LPVGDALLQYRRLGSRGCSRIVSGAISSPVEGPVEERSPRTGGCGSWAACQLARFGIEDAEYSDPKARDFYTFEVSFRNPGGMQVFGHYAVHKITGAVWEFVVCRKLDSEGLRRLQSTLRRRIRLGSDELKRLEDVAPCYEPE